MVNDKDLLSFDYKKDFPLLAVNDVAYLTTLLPHKSLPALLR